MVVRLIPYEVEEELPFTSLVLKSVVFGVINKFTCHGEVLYACFEEMDCDVPEDIATEIIEDASAEAGLTPALVVRTKKGYHIYFKEYYHTFFDSLLATSKFRDALPCACRDIRHLLYAIRTYFNMKGWERYVLRVTPTKYVRDYFKVVYWRPPSDPCMRRFLVFVKRAYTSSTLIKLYSQLLLGGKK